MNINKSVIDMSSVLIEHLDQIIQIFSIALIIEPFFEVPLEGAVKVPLHLTAQTLLCN